MSRGKKHFRRRFEFPTRENLIFFAMAKNIQLEILCLLIASHICTPSG
jgi:hypothetical protein